MTDLSLASPVIVPRRPRRGFTPTSLFRSGEAGAWFDASDLTTLFQDSAGTVLATADNDPIWLAMDVSGNLAHAAAAAEGSRPELGVDAGHRYIRHWGVTALVATLADLGADATVFWANDSGAHILTGQTISGATTLLQDTVLLSAGYIDRALTAAETSRLTAHLDRLASTAGLTASIWVDATGKVLVDGNGYGLTTISRS